MSVLRALKLPTALWNRLGGWRLNSGLTYWFLCVIQKKKMTKDLSVDDGVILCASTWARVGEAQMKELSILGSLEHSSFKLPLYMSCLGLSPGPCASQESILPPSCHPIQTLTSIGTRFEGAQKFPSNIKVRIDPQGWLVKLFVLLCICFSGTPVCFHHTQDILLRSPYVPSLQPLHLCIRLLCSLFIHQSLIETSRS